MEKVRLIYYPLFDRDNFVDKCLNLEEVSKFLLKFNEGLKLLEGLAWGHSFGSNKSSIYRGVPEEVLGYSLQIQGDKESVKSGAIKYIEACGFPDVIQLDYKLLEEYLTLKGKKLEKQFLGDFRTRIVSDNK